MKKMISLLTPVLMLAVAACGASREEQAAEAEAKAKAEEAAQVAALPAVLAITAQGTYRCADNSIVKIDFLGANEAASITVGSDVPVKVDAPKDAEGKVVADRALQSADGAVKLAGSGDAVNLTLPGKGAQSCKK